eukprot:TRINITY_DN229_c0_g1_i3.p1 TRINITY_DN229_c0_g1~~TRINITY_DN229_c0_g1_i3.p1  ORF type:complete len:213 (+),score=127.15 TRINITY_DN229_c0_g1_i3:95-640(+)
MFACCGIRKAVTVTVVEDKPVEQPAAPADTAATTTSTVTEEKQEAPVVQPVATEEKAAEVPAASTEEKAVRPSGADRTTDGAHTHGMKIRVVVGDNLVILHTTDRHSVVYAIQKITEGLKAKGTNVEIADIATEEMAAKGEVLHHGDLLHKVYGERARLIAVVKGSDAHKTPQGRQGPHHC